MPVLRFPVTPPVAHRGFRATRVRVRGEALKRDVSWPGRKVRGAARPLPTLRNGESGVIARIDAVAPERLVKLSSLGVMPGVRVVLVQRNPAVVLRIAETTIAVDRAVADEILVEPDGPDTGS